MKTQDELWNVELNKEMLRTFESLGTMDVSEEIKKRLSAPLRTMVGPEYIPGSSLLIVGQETHGWGGNPQTVGSSFHSFESYHGKYSSDYILMEGQTDFLLNRYESTSAKTINSPFWKANVKVSGADSMADLLSAGVAWGNLMACDLDEKSPLRKDAMNSDDLAAFLDYSNKAFKGLLELTRPKVAMLFTGPNYDWILEDWFNLPQNWKDTDLRSLPECSDPDEHLLKFVKVFNWNGTLFIRSYHPAYLTRNKKKGYLKILDILAATLKNLGVTKP